MRAEDVYSRFLLVHVGERGSCFTVTGSQDLFGCTIPSKLPQASALFVFRHTPKPTFLLSCPHTPLPQLNVPALRSPERVPRKEGSSHDWMMATEVRPLTQLKSI